MARAKRTKIKDLKVRAEKAKKVKGGLNPQPEPPIERPVLTGPNPISQAINPMSKITTPTTKS